MTMTDQELIEAVAICKCGCGEKTKLSNYTDERHGAKKGQPLRYILGHNTKGTYGYRKKNTQARRETSRNGYRQLIYRAIVEEILGYILPLKAVIHHIDGNWRNNEPSNLLVCENDTYHQLIHRRARALQACGHASWRKCCYCKNYDDPKNLSFSGNKTVKIYHKKCAAEHQIKKYHATKSNTGGLAKAQFSTKAQGDAETGL
jgi:hypothetical protein